MILEGKFQPYYKAFALLDSGKIDECLLFCKARVESGDIGLYMGSNGETFYKDIISRFAYIDNDGNNDCLCLVYNQDSEISKSVFRR